jgi:hypothetical protein
MQTSAQSDCMRRARSACRVLSRGTAGALARGTVLILVAIAAMALGVVAAEPAAFGASNGQWAIEPYNPPGTIAGRSIFNFSVRAGQTVSDEATLANLSDKPLQFKIYAADAYNTPKGGGFALRLSHQRQHEVGVWVHLPFSEYRLAPKTQVTFPFKLTVPLGVGAGDYAGGIVAENVTPSSEVKGHVHILVHLGVGVRIYVRVLGKVTPGIAVTGVGGSDQSGTWSWATGGERAKIAFSVANVGNAIINEAEAKVRVVDIFGQTVARFRPVLVSALLPGSKARFTESWTKAQIAGPEHVEVTVTSLPVQTAGLSSVRLSAEGSTTFWIVPWTLLLIVLAALALIVLWLRHMRHKRRLEMLRLSLALKDEQLEASGPSGR